MDETQKTHEGHQFNLLPAGVVAGAWLLELAGPVPEVALEWPPDAVVSTWLTVRPSIDAHTPPCRWHGFITNGEILSC